jgi:tRNA(fMet)-specific endonuclease VapC
MSGKSYLLDTNIVIGLFANESSITEKIKPTTSRIFIPSIVFGELFYGAEQSSKKEENRKKIDALAQVSFVLECDLDSARQYGRIKSRLKDKGAPIPENDIWIAALAQQHQLTLVTRDKHFGIIPGKLVTSPFFNNSKLYDRQTGAPVKN